MLEDFAGIDTAHHRKLREVNRFALHVGAGIQQDEFVFLPRHHRGNAAAVHAGDASDLEGAGGENAASVAEGNERIGLALADQFGGAGDGGIPFLAQRDDRLVRHLHHFRGVDDADAMVAKTARRQGGMDFLLVADEIDDGEVFAFLQGALHAGDDHTATVVAAHDIHCDSHGQPVTRPR